MAYSHHGVVRVRCSTPSGRKDNDPISFATFSHHGVLCAALLNAHWQIRHYDSANGRRSDQHAQRSKPWCEQAFD